ncbi:hypothetical protein Ga0123462_1560 [Mariprofundus ferrinatatus]|uniref:Uncharacterized protein n=1 Tax=Mariprofundus ferrinatatus TaxID=1921087 RepID=A0A2K8L842_9PROT|nr:hypothetical protein Ga0123462_1560 [Mariprofundus ferrinatatus]
MEQCYEYLGCHNVDCPMYRLKAPMRCWEVEDTLCNNHGIELERSSHPYAKKEDVCALGCIYYHEAKGRV